MGATDVEERLAFELAGSPEATAAARRLLLAGNGALPGNVRDDVLLLVTELVTNAVRHADAGPTRRCVSSSGTGRVRSGSRSATRARVSSRKPQTGGDEKGGWGPLLVDRIADCWAITPTATGTCVSFEIRYDESRAG